jgi:hypothetical protein
MGRKLVALVCVCMCLFLVSSVYAKGKPSNGGGSPDQLVTLTGDIAGEEIIVEGAFPNRGPFPDFTAILLGGLPAGTYDGKIFMGRYGKKKDANYLVQFWTEDGAISIEVRGGKVVKERHSGLTTATFIDCDANNLDTGEFIAVVNLVITRQAQ